MKDEDFWKNWKLLRDLPLSLELMERIRSMGLGQDSHGRSENSSLGCLMRREASPTRKKVIMVPLPFTSISPRRVNK